ncbi:uncharacterized protein HMPREF1541_09504 [Cyphellophora europaea CBS 101466]|uniref:Pre-rRNA-processing protein IPI3 n=1 Tax=Cyphellophora europaea (strain CBS 101466) TaxID=1220924 RepID=W2SAB6_CYPE1|nr:uncharacterized protein HMPREF1541_09504 [Cyphellophora europaea CBS 101466]ETN45671.1 hypothetical protein HMPREF1541_09504 [Cyphellophora europaea CBS 101466]
MLTESFIAAVLAANKPAQHLATSLKDVGIFLHELQPQPVLRHGYKKSSVQPRCMAVSRSHVFTAQSEKVVVNVYSRDKGNQEATVPFPEKITSLVYADGPEVLVMGTEEGKLILWEVGTGRITTSSASHLQAVSQLCLTPDDYHILSASTDSTVLVWSLSSLLSFQGASESYTEGSAMKTPVATFSQHRDAITALDCGHSRPSTNFAVSASRDGTCHIWHIETCSILRTVLLPSAPTCLTLDPADRAIYLGDTSGKVTSVDLLSLGKTGMPKPSDTSLPVQVGEEDQWTPASDPGSCHTIALTYDATALLSGHENGSILKWDIAKRKVANDLAKLGQPVTNLRMLEPEGLQKKHQRAFSVPEVVKPRLEFNARLEHGTSGIPANYKLHAVLTGAPMDQEVVDDPFSAAITSNGWPASLLDAAIRAIDDGAVAGPSNGISVSAIRTERLGEEVAELKKTLAAYKKTELEMMERSLARMKQRDDIDLQRRQAYHDAIKRGEDKKTANAAMNAAMEASKKELKALEVESDAEPFEEPVDTS